MEKRSTLRTAVLCAIAFVGWSVCGGARVQPSPITRIMAGTDYLQTTPGAEFILKKGNTDTISTRAADAIFKGYTATTKIQLMALNLRGTFTGAAGQTCTITAVTFTLTSASGGCENSIISSETHNAMRGRQ